MLAKGEACLSCASVKEKKIFFYEIVTRAQSISFDQRSTLKKHFEYAHSICYKLDRFIIVCTFFKIFWNGIAYKKDEYMYS